MFQRYKYIIFFVLVLWAISPSESQIAFLFPDIQNRTNKTISIFDTTFSNKKELQEELLLFIHIASRFCSDTSFTHLKDIQRIYKKWNIYNDIEPKTADLKSISFDLSLEKIYLWDIVINPNQVIIIPRIYYPSSNSIVNRTAIKSYSLISTINKWLLQDFSCVSFQNQNKKSFKNAIFVIDESPKNMPEMKILAKKIYNTNSRNIGICSFSGKNWRSQYFSGIRASQKSYHFLLKSKNYKMNPNGKNIFNSINCALNMAQKNSLQSNHTKIIFFIGSYDNNSLEKIRIQSILRKLSMSYPLYIIGTGTLNFFQRQYWFNIAMEFQNYSPHFISYSDIIYQIKIGTASGKEFYIFKKGNRILEGYKKNITYANEITIPKWGSYDFNKDNFIKKYTSIKKRKMITKYPLEIRFSNSANKIFSVQRANISNEKILVQIQNQNHWIHLNKNNIKKLRKGYSYYFFVDTTNYVDDIIFTQPSDFEKVYSTSLGIPKSLMLNINKFLQNISFYQGRSIFDTSMYIFYGKVLDLSY